MAEVRKLGKRSQLLRVVCNATRIEDGWWGSSDKVCVTLQDIAVEGVGLSLP